LEKERDLFLAGVEHFNATRFYESHEEWEEVWLVSEDPKKLFYQILILLAAVGVHYQKGRTSAAQRAKQKIQRKIEELKKSPCEVFGLRVNDLKEILAQFMVQKDLAKPIIKLAGV